jgi:hypothetical protein
MNESGGGLTPFFIALIPWKHEVRPSYFVFEGKASQTVLPKGHEKGANPLYKYFFKL